MNEELLQFIWRERLFYDQNLRCTNGKKLEIVKVGKHNLNSGPDFFNAEIKLDDLTLVGNIEIHTKSSHWLDHNHQKDKAYNNVILHVVLEDNKEVYSESRRLLDTLIIDQYLYDSINLSLSKLELNEDREICSSSLAKFSKVRKYAFLDSLMIKRLKRKTESLSKAKEDLSMGWLKLFLYSLFSSVGSPVNAIPMERLASLIDINVLLKRRNEYQDIEAYVFGLSGFLSQQNSDLYFQKLKKRYAYLKVKYGIESEMEIHEWKYSRMRYHSFPVKRIGELISLLCVRVDDLLSWMEEPTINNIDKFFSFHILPYWKSHYDFGKKIKSKNKGYTPSFKIRLYLNSIVPFSLLYNKFRNIEFYETELMSLPVEANKSIEKWKSKSFEIRNSWDSQAILELEKSYCNEKKCLNCTIGKSILKDEQVVYKNKRVFGDPVFWSLPMVG